GVPRGRLAPPLNETGRAQIAALAERIVSMAPARILTSPLERARASADLIAARCDVEVEVDDRLVEIDYGEYDGVALAALDQDVARRWRVDADFVPPGGESLTAGQARVPEVGRRRFD